MNAEWDGQLVSIVVETTLLCTMVAPSIATEISPTRGRKGKFSIRSMHFDARKIINEATPTALHTECLLFAHKLLFFIFFYFFARLMAPRQSNLLAWSHEDMAETDNWVFTNHSELFVIM
jgi:hypothetical protein